MACPAFATLHNGAKMPLVGYGTWNSNGDDLAAGLDAALAAGYRLIDTAAAYGNEAVIGKVLKEKWLGPGKLRREDLFITTKLPFIGMRPENVERFLKKSLADLQLDYVDLYLIHSPMGIHEGDGSKPGFPTGPDGKILHDWNTDLVALWKEMEKQVDAGRAKAIGISKFNKRQVQRILDNSRIKPANLQNELHVYLQEKPMVEFCHKNNVTVTAFSSLGSPGSAVLFNNFGLEANLPNLLADPVVCEVAKKCGKTSGQILLKHVVQRGIAVIPKSNNPDRIKQNIQIFDFELSPEDMAKLSNLDKGKDGRIFDLKFIVGCEKHPEYPFHEWP